jgi:hypothetical protein
VPRVGPGARDARATPTAASAGHPTTAARSATTPTTTPLAAAADKGPSASLPPSPGRSPYRQYTSRPGLRAAPRGWTFSAPALTRNRLLADRHYRDGLLATYRTVSEAAAARQLLVSLDSVTTLA